MHHGGFDRHIIEKKLTQEIFSQFCRAKFYNNVFYHTALEAAVCQFVESCHIEIKDSLKEYFEERKLDVPVLCENIMNHKISIDTAIDLLCGKENLSDIVAKLRTKLCNKFSFVSEAVIKKCVEFNKASYSEHEAVILIEDADIITETIYQNLFIDRIGSRCFESIIDTYVPDLISSLVNQYISGTSIWQTISETFNGPILKWEISSRLMGVMENTRIQLTNDLCKSVSTIIFDAYDKVTYGSEQLPGEIMNCA